MLKRFELNSGNKDKKAKLVLEDGSIYYGNSFGYEKSCAGEVVFTTGMAGYPESLTDPSYAGQILIFTYPLIGNYGIGDGSKDEFGVLKNFESGKVQATGLIVSENCEEPSHWNSTKTLREWLIENKIPALSGVDTRALTTQIREKGVMLGKIVIDDDLELEDPCKRNLVADVSIKDKIEYKAGDVRVVLIDCGAKLNIIRCLLKRGITVIRVPWDYDFSQEEYDGILVSNGPGDPKQCKATIENLRKAMEQNKPIMGICLGNQLLALAAGADTYKLKYGHRSQNQPCVKIGTKRCYITAQNHGYAVDEKTMPEGWEPWFRNVNDETNEGIRHETKPFFSVQFHPEASCGPVDTEFLFDRFIEMMQNGK